MKEFLTTEKWLEKQREAKEYNSIYDWIDKAWLARQDYIWEHSAELEKKETQRRYKRWARLPIEPTAPPLVCSNWDEE